MQPIAGNLARRVGKLTKRRCPEPIIVIHCVMQRNIQWASSLDQGPPQKDRGLGNKIDPQQFIERKETGEIFSNSLTFGTDGDGVSVDSVYLRMGQQISNLGFDRAGTVQVVT